MLSNEINFPKCSQGRGYEHSYTTLVTETWTTPTYENQPHQHHSRQVVCCSYCGHAIDPLEDVKPKISIDMKKVGV